MLANFEGANFTAQQLFALAKNPNFTISTLIAIHTIVFRVERILYCNINNSFMHILTMILCSLPRMIIIDSVDSEHIIMLSTHGMNLLLS